MSVMVPDDGRLDARLVLIGEAPGRRELSAGRPFVGPAGHQLDAWWAQVGLRRYDCYVTNVLSYMPSSIDAVPFGEMQQAAHALHERLAALTDPWLIVPTGNYALHALTGKGKVSWHQRDGRWARPGITSLRGSIMEYIDLNGRHIKVIPTIHPAATLRRGGVQAAQWHRACVADWKRVAEDAQFRELRLPQRTHETHPSADDVVDFVRDAIQQPGYVAADIETAPSRGAILCIAFSYDPAWSLTIPLTRAYWQGDVEWRTVWGALWDLFSSCAMSRLVMQNGLYDAYWLTEQGYGTFERWQWDTRAMHYVLDPLALHRLEYLTSVYTREPYYKDECKDPSEKARFSSDNEALWTYCGRDAACTLEVFYALRLELERCGLLDVYVRHYGQRFGALLTMSRHGLRVDTAAMRERAVALCAERVVAQAAIRDTAGGAELFAAKGKRELSNTKLRKLLYEEWKLPKQLAKKAGKHGEERSVSANEVALKRLALRFPDRVAPLAQAILSYRGLGKQLEFLNEQNVDADGRMRGLYQPFTATGRLHCTETPVGTGRNLQNIQRGATRRMFVPD